MNLEDLQIILIALVIVTFVVGAAIDKKWQTLLFFADFLRVCFAVGAFAIGIWMGGVLSMIITGALFGLTLLVFLGRVGLLKRPQLDDGGD